MATIRTRLQVLAIFVVLLGLSGCPLFIASPKLLVSPGAISFSAVQSVRTISIANEGGGSLTWTIEEISREDEDAPWIASDVPWLTVGTLTGSTGTEDSQVDLTASRLGLPAGIINNTGIRVISNGGTQLLPISLVVDTTVFPSTTLISLDPTDFFLTFDIINTGEDPTNWQLFFVPEPGNPETATDFPPDFVIIPGDVGTTAPGASTEVNISWSVPLPNFDILLVADNGQTLISVQFDAFIPGLEIRPDPVVLYVSTDPNTTVQPTSELIVKNTGLAGREVSVVVLNLQTSPIAPPISVNPASQIIESGKESKYIIQVTDPTTILVGTGNYELEVRSGGKFTRVGVDVQLAALPEIVLSAPPSPEDDKPAVLPINLMDFGTEAFQGTFYVVNMGSMGSQLYFKIIVAPEDVVDPPIVLDIDPNVGDTNRQEADFFIEEEGRFVDGQQVTITIDRNALVEDLTSIDLLVQATNPDHTVVNPSVPEARLTLQITRPPLTIEGALNRSRPPYMGRWVLLVRDRQGNVVPAQTQEDFDNLRFHILEEGFPLDDTETNQFLGKPKSINLAIVLDYSASLYNAGTELLDDPLPKGEATQNMIDSTKELIRDLPPNTRIALFYHHDRSQNNYMMHQFTDDKAALIQRLDEFTIPEALYGSSKVFDAVDAAVDAVIAEDPADALPFDETDVRAVLFITDGEDNSSVQTSDSVTSKARESLVRLYPVSYDPGSAGPSIVELLAMANESGGHFYNAGRDVLNLDKVLSNAFGLTFLPGPLLADSIGFKIFNPTEFSMNYSNDIVGVHPWITSVSPVSNTILPGLDASISVNVDPSQIAPSTSVEARIDVNSNLGRGQVYVNMTTTASGAIASLTLNLVDQPGKFWDDQQNQFMLTYNTPRQQDFEYDIEVEYRQPDGVFTSGFFTDQSFFYIGDPLAGQISLVTDGINSENQAIVHVHADFVPRNVSRFRMRFYTHLPLTTPPAAVAAFDSVIMTVTLDDEDSLLIPDDPNAQAWNLVNEGDGKFLVLTEQDNPLPFSSFGNLLKISFTNLEPFIAAFDGLPQQPEFYIQMRVDNDIYYSPAGPISPSDTKYFLYPSGILNENRPLIVGTRPDLAAPARDVLQLNQFVILDPEHPLAFDIDEDGFRDFNDPAPFDESLPNNISVPNVVEISGAETSESVTVRNNRLDTFAWSVDASTVPAWLSINPVTGGTLAPGSSQVLTYDVDRTGLAPGVYNAELRLDLGIFPDEFVPISMTVLQP